MFPLRLFDTFVLSTELMQVLIRKLEEKILVENRKILYQGGISVTSEVKRANLIQFTQSHKALIVTSE